MLRARTNHRTPARGFSFIELIVVMGAMGMLMGLAVGYLGNIGQATFIAQTRSILSETAYRCVNASSGGGQAVLTLREVETDMGGRKLRIGAQVANTILSHQFETLDFASGARRPEVNGRVKVNHGRGRVGNSAKFEGGYLSFRRQSIFAPTEGFEVDVWVKPDPQGRVMTVIAGGESYEIMLVRNGDTRAFDVRLRMLLRLASESRIAAATPRTYETSGGVLLADGRWSRLRVSFDGLDAEIRINGLAVYEGEDLAPAGESLSGEIVRERVHRIEVPESGALPLTISSGERPFQGEMDALQVRGMFRSEESERDLPGQPDAYEVLYPSLPLRVVFANGGLDPTVHKMDQIIRIQDRVNPDDPPLRLTIGMFGVISSVYEQPGAGGPEGVTDDDGKRRVPEEVPVK